MQISELVVSCRFLEIANHLFKKNNFGDFCFFFSQKL